MTQGCKSSTWSAFSGFGRKARNSTKGFYLLYVIYSCLSQAVLFLAGGREPTLEQWRARAGPHPASLDPSATAVGEEWLGKGFAYPAHWRGG